MDIWVRKFAYEWAQSDETFLLNNLHQSNPANPSHKERRIRRSAELRWSSSKGGTFRGLSNDGSNEDEHQQFIKTIYPNSHCLYDREPFSAYDLRLLDINMTGSDELMQQDERKRCAQRIQEFWHCLFCCFGNCRLTSREIEDEDEGIES
uniref:Uncharacterized protein n=1 Tax=Wuchereria bancrofti TaxID=6293 RepID=A0A1I8EG41_WUCBA